MAQAKTGTCRLHLRQEVLRKSHVLPLSPVTLISG